MFKVRERAIDVLVTKSDIFLATKGVTLHHLEKYHNTDSVVDNFLNNIIG